MLGRDDRLWRWIAICASVLLAWPVAISAQAPLGSHPVMHAPAAPGQQTDTRWQAAPLVTLPLPAPGTASPPAGPTVQPASQPRPLDGISQIESLPLPPLPPEIANDRPGITLGDLVTIASDHHPALRKAAEEYRAAQGLALQAGLYPNPTLAASSPQWAGSSSQYNGFAQQEIVVAHKLQLQRAAAQRQVWEAEYAFRTAWFAVLTDIRQQFYATLVAQERVAIMQDLAGVADRSRSAADKLLQVGEGTRGDVLLLDIELDRAKVQLANAEVYLATGKRQMALVTGVPNMEIHLLVGDLRARTPEYELLVLPQAVAEVNSQADGARTEVSRSQILLRRASVEPIPNVFLMGGFQYQVQPAPHSQGLAQLTIEVPLFDRNQGNIRAAEATICAALAESRRVELELANKAATAYQSYRAACQQVDIYEQHIMPKARESLEITQRLYVQGEIDFLRLLQAQKALVEATLSYIEAQEDRWKAAATIAGLLQSEQFP